MFMRIFFYVQGDYRKIGDVILKNLNQNTMEHYGRWTFETKMRSKAFFCYTLNFNFYAAKYLESQSRYIDTHGVVLDKLEQTIHKSSKFEQVWMLKEFKITFIFLFQIPFIFLTMASMNI